MSFRIVGISAAVGLAALALSGCVDDYGYYNGYYGGYGPVLYDYSPGPFYGGYYYWSGGHRYYRHRGYHGHYGSYHHGYYHHGSYHHGYHGGYHGRSSGHMSWSHGGHGGHGHGGDRS